MADAVHPLLGGGLGFNTPANDISVSDGQVHVDATPLYLFGVVLTSAGVLYVLKRSGFKFVIGVGG